MFQKHSYAWPIKVIKFEVSRPYGLEDNNVEISCVSNMSPTQDRVKIRLGHAQKMWGGGPKIGSKKGGSSPKTGQKKGGSSLKTGQKRSGRFSKIVVKIGLFEKFGLF